MPTSSSERNQQVLETALRQIARPPRRDLLAGVDDDFAGLGVEQVGMRNDAAPLGRLERHFPAALQFLDDDLGIERLEDFLVIEAQRIEQRRRRQLAAAVDAHECDVLGVEFEVEPRAAIGNDAGSKQKLAGDVRAAAVMIEEHAGRTVHLRNDHALGTVDDERAVLRHERHVAHVDVLLLDVLDRLRARSLR